MTSSGQQFKKKKKGIGNMNREEMLDKLRTAYNELDEIHHEAYEGDDGAYEIDNDVCDALDSIYEAIKKLGGDL